jgi:hypothetical protein
MEAILLDTMFELPSHRYRAAPRCHLFRDHHLLDPFEGVLDANRVWDLVLNESY